MTFLERSCESSEALTLLSEALTLLVEGRVRSSLPPRCRRALGSRIPSEVPPATYLSCPQYQVIVIRSKLTSRD